MNIVFYERNFSFSDQSESYFKLPNKYYETDNFFFAESFSPRSIFPESEKKVNKNFFHPPPFQYEDHLDLSMPHIRGIKSPMRSNEVPIDREHPGAHPVNFPYIAIHLYGRGWPSK